MANYRPQPNWRDHYNPRCGLTIARIFSMEETADPLVCFASVWLGESLKMAVMTANIKKVARRFFGVPEFHFYALADGIAILFSRHGAWNASRPARPPPDFHPELDLNLNPA